MLKVNWNRSTLFKNVEHLEPGTVFEWEGSLYLKCKQRHSEKTNVLKLSGEEKFQLEWFDGEPIIVTIIENAVLNIGD